MRARAQDPGVPYRAAAALAVSADSKRYSILEAPLHLPTTLARSPRFAPPEGTRGAPIDSLVLTSAGFDASGAAPALGVAHSVRISSPRAIREALIDHDANFRDLEAVWSGMPWDRPFPLDREETLEARLFPLPGPTPDAFREVSPRLGRARCGVRVTDTRSGFRLVWAPRITRFDSATLAELRAADLRFIDGTCYSADEVRRIRPGAREPAELGHLPIDGREGSLAYLSGMRGESVYVHIAGSNPLCDTKSEESERVRSAGVTIGVDAMELAPA